MFHRIFYRHSAAEDWRLAPLKSLDIAELMTWARDRAAAVGRQMDFQIVESMTLGAQFISTGFGEVTPSPKAPGEFEGPPDIPGQLRLVEDSEGEKPVAAQPSESTEPHEVGPLPPLGDDSTEPREAGPDEDGVVPPNVPGHAHRPPKKNKNKNPAKRGQRERDDDGAAPVPQPA